MYCVARFKSGSQPYRFLDSLFSVRQGLCYNNSSSLSGKTFRLSLCVPSRPDGHQNNLRSSAYESLMEIVKNSAKDCYPAVQKTTLVIMERLQQVLQMEVRPGWRRRGPVLSWWWSRLRGSVYFLRRVEGLYKNCCHLNFALPTPVYLHM